MGINSTKSKSPWSRPRQPNIQLQNTLGILPPEVRAVIGSHLSAVDVIAFSTTSQLSEVLGRDMMEDAFRADQRAVAEIRQSSLSLLWGHLISVESILRPHSDPLAARPSEGVVATAENQLIAIYSKITQLHQSNLTALGPAAWRQLELKYNHVRLMTSAPRFYPEMKLG